MNEELQRAEDSLVFACDVLQAAHSTACSHEHANPVAAIVLFQLLGDARRLAQRTAMLRDALEAQSKVSKG